MAAKTALQPRAMGTASLLLCALATCCLLQAASAYVQMPPLVPHGGTDTPPVTNWLLTPLSTGTGSISNSARAAWMRIGAKLWTFLSKLDRDWVDANNATVPAAMGTPVFGPSVSCGYFARQWIRMAYHDCGTFDVGNTGSQGDTGRARFGCNGSLRRELAPCTTSGPECVGGVEARFNINTGAWLPEDAFAGVRAKYGMAAIDYAIDTATPRTENRGMAMSMAFLYQVQMETQVDETGSYKLASVSMADLIIYAGHMAVAKCGGPHIEFQPGRPDAFAADGANRLPNPTASLSVMLSHFWTNGLTHFDAVVLRAVSSTSCIGTACFDSTPNSMDTAWVRAVMAITSATNTNICKFSGATPPTTPVRACVLPTDAELNARADTRAYLRAINGTAAISAAANTAAYWPVCSKQSTVPAATVCTEPSATFTPYFLVGSTGGAATATTGVNLCKRAGLPAPGQPCRTDQDNFNEAFASSYFRMGKMFGVRPIGSTVTTNMGLAFGVATQRCYAGLVKVGELLAPGQQPSANPQCACCPAPVPQAFCVGGCPVFAASTSAARARAQTLSASAAAATAAVVTEAGPAVATAAVEQAGVLPQAG